MNLKGQQMNKLTDLQNQISKIMDDNKPTIILNDKADRAIRELEKELTQASFKEDFSLLISQLDEERATESFGGSGFTREQYSIGWKCIEGDNFRLVLTNIPHNNSKILIKTPSQFKEDIQSLLPIFAQKIIQKYSNQ